MNRTTAGHVLFTILDLTRAHCIKGSPNVLRSADRAATFCVLPSIPRNFHNDIISPQSFIAFKKIGTENESVCMSFCLFLYVFRLSSPAFLGRFPFIRKTRLYRWEIKWSGLFHWKMFWKERNTFTVIPHFYRNYRKISVPFVSSH